MRSISEFLNKINKIPSSFSSFSFFGSPRSSERSSPQTPRDHSINNSDPLLQQWQVVPSPSQANQTELPDVEMIDLSSESEEEEQPRVKKTNPPTESESLSAHTANSPNEHEDMQASNQHEIETIPQQTQRIDETPSSSTITHQNKQLPELPGSFDAETLNTTFNNIFEYLYHETFKDTQFPYIVTSPKPLVPQQSTDTESTKIHKLQALEKQLFKPLEPQTPPPLTQHSFAGISERIEDTFIDILQKHQIYLLIDLLTHHAKNPQSKEYQRLQCLIKNPVLDRIWKALLEDQGSITLYRGNQLKTVTLPRYFTKENFMPLKQHRVDNSLYQPINRTPKERHPFDIYAGIAQYSRSTLEAHFLHHLRLAIISAQKEKYNEALQSLEMANSRFKVKVIQNLIRLIRQKMSSDTVNDYLISTAIKVAQHQYSIHFQHCKASFMVGQQLGDFGCMDWLYKLDFDLIQDAIDQQATLSPDCIDGMLQRAEQAKQQHWSVGHLLAAETYFDLGRYYQSLINRHPHKSSALTISNKASFNCRYTQFSKQWLINSVDSSRVLTSDLFTLKQKRNACYKEAVKWSQVAILLEPYCDDITHNGTFGKGIADTHLFYSEDHPKTIATRQEHYQEKLKQKKQEGSIVEAKEAARQHVEHYLLPSIGKSTSTHNGSSHEDSVMRMRS